MAENKIDPSSSLGDISAILGSPVADLSWLVVDEEMYRATEALPKQNLDIIPELAKALASEDGVPTMMTYREHAMGLAPLADTARIASFDVEAVRIRTARMVMAGLSDSEIAHRLSLEFPPAGLELASSAIASELSERGLIGSVYIRASDFPRAAHDPQEKKFARVAGKFASYVVGTCGGQCDCSSSGVCRTFGDKRVVSSVDEIPWGRGIASRYASRLASEKRPIQIPAAESPESWRDAVRTAFLQVPEVVRPDGIQTALTQQRQAQVQVSSKDVADFIARRTGGPESDPALSPARAKYARRMMEGHDDRASLLAATDPDLQNLASEHGILGHTYVDIDAAGGCRHALEIVRSRNLSPDYVLRRSASCSMCGGASDGACAELCRTASLVRFRPDLDRRDFGRALVRAAREGRVEEVRARTAASRAPVNGDWNVLTARVNLMREAAVPVKTEYSGARMIPFYGQPGRSDVATSEVNPEEVRMTISHLMNTGLQGRALQEAILLKYARKDLAQIPEVGRRAAADDGIQGQLFIDPTAYSDYGGGCNEGSLHFRKRGAPHVMASDGCTGCMLQTHPGWCSKYAKTMIRSVPTEVRERVASERRTLPVIQTAPFRNPVAEYGLASEELVVEPSKSPATVSITIPGGNLDD